MPRGKPEVVPPKPDFDWAVVRKDVEHVLPRHALNERRLAEWDEFIAERPKDLEQAKRCSTLPKWNFARIPREHNSLDDHRSAAARTVLNDLAIVRQPATIASNAVAGSGSEGTAERRARNTYNAEHGMAVLTANSFALVLMDYIDEPGDADGCHIPAVLVQFGESFDVDTTKPDAMVMCKWWEPKPPGGTYDGDWRKWTTNRRIQYETEIRRDSIVMVDVQFTRKEPLAGGVRRLNKATKVKIAQDPKLKYDEFSIKPPD